MINNSIYAANGSFSMYHNGLGNPWKISTSAIIKNIDFLRRIHFSERFHSSCWLLTISCPGITQTRKKKAKMGRKKARMMTTQKRNA